MVKVITILSIPSQVLWNLLLQAGAYSSIAFLLCFPEPASLSTSGRSAEQLPPLPDPQALPSPGGSGPEKAPGRAQAQRGSESDGVDAGWEEPPHREGLHGAL